MHKMLTQLHVCSQPETLAALDEARAASIRVELRYYIYLTFTYQIELKVRYM